MATKFEQYLSGDAERKQRKENIDKLQKMIAADEDVLAVIPNDRSNFDTQRERRLMRDHITRLKEMLNDEIAAHNRTLEGNLDGINL